MKQSDFAKARFAFANMIAEYRAAEIWDSSLFGILIDSWYAYERGGHFVKRPVSALQKVGNPRTFNNPNSEAEFRALREIPCRSIEADRVLKGVSAERLVKDHSIPRAVLRDLAFEELPFRPKAEDVDDWLRRRYRVAVLTKVEHDALPWPSSMPPSWDGHDHYCRYIGIKLVPQ